MDRRKHRISTGGYACERFTPGHEQLPAPVDETITAAATGAATVTVDLHDRLEVSVVPDTA
jgi:hypothetical protein